MRVFFLVFFSLCFVVQSAYARNLTQKEQGLLKGARSCLRADYDAGYYSGGPPPKGKGACTDVLYYAFQGIGVNLQDELDRDIRANLWRYPEVTKRDRNIDYRRCPNLIAWFAQFTTSLTKKAGIKEISQWQPGAVVFWSLGNNGDTTHCGIVSDRKNAKGIPLAIHNFPPCCKEEDVLKRWMITGHFRY